MRKKKPEQEDATGPTPVGSPRITPVDVQQKEFRLAFRGYNERDVDAFLDEITEELALYVEENRRLREDAGIPTPSAVAQAQASPDTADASREAEDILARAREEASRVVRDAELRAAAFGAAATPGDHGAVAPFLNTERDFLQSLASLVQGHAENVKLMVKAHRARTATPTADTTPDTTPQPVRVPDSEPTPTATSAEPAAPAPTSSGTGTAISESAREATGAAPASAERPARSLRELFWEED